MSSKKEKKRLRLLEEEIQKLKEKEANNLKLISELREENERLTEKNEELYSENWQLKRI